MFSFTCYLVSVLVGLGVLRKYRERSWGRCSNKKKLTGKVVIVTGANSGIGYEIAKEMAAREAQVVMACRNLDAASEAVFKIKNELHCSSVVVPMLLDLGSIASIENFVEDIKSTYTQIHVLVANAGVSYPANLACKTKDGFEIHMGTNHLGHFLLTNLLLEMFDKSHSRIVVISSALHEKGTLHLDDLNLEKVDAKNNAYANSKLANVYFCKELAERTRNTGIKVYAVCPGWVYTNLFRYHTMKWYHYLFIFPIAFFFMRNVEQGAQTAIYCATEDGISEESGLIYRNCQKYESKIFLDDEISHKLWEASARLIKDANDAKMSSDNTQNYFC